MNTRGLLVATIILAILGGVLYWSNHQKEGDADPEKAILKLKPEDITGLSIHWKVREPYEFAKNASGTWEVTAPRPFPVNQEAIGSLVSTLAGLHADQIVDDKATNLAQYDLATPNSTLTAHTKDGKSYALLLGNIAPGVHTLYAAVQGSPRVFTIGADDRATIDADPVQLLDKRLLPVDSAKINTLELVGPDKDLEFVQKDGDWQMQKPQTARADGAKINQLISDLESAQDDPLRAQADVKKAEAGYASGTNYATLKITDDKGFKSLEVHDSKEGYFAKSSVVDGVYRISGDLPQELGRGSDDFRDKHLFEFQFSQPEKIEYHEGPTSFTLTRKGTDWSYNGQKIAAPAPEVLVSKLRDLSAIKFVDSGFTTPSLDITVTWQDGKRVEKVLIAKGSNDSIAQIQGEPALYELDTNTVDALEKSANDVKPGGSGSK